MFASKKQKGFTLIELLVVAVILGILAAVVVPQFGSSADDTKASALKSNLSAMRSAIDLYAQQHGGVYPGIAKSDGTATTGGDATDFTNQLTRFSNAAGKTSATKVSGTDTFPYGPYLKEIPKDPVKDSNAVALATGTDVTAVNAGTDTTGGWKFYTALGRLIVNNSAKDNAGIKYDAY